MKEIIIRTKINKIGNRKTMKKFWLFEKTDKVDKRLTSLTKKKTDKTQITNVKNEILKYHYRLCRHQRDNMHILGTVLYI